MRLFRLIVLCCLVSLPAVAQNAFYYSNIAGTQAPGNLERVLPNAAVVVCNFPANNSVPCTNLATTFTDSTATISCPITSQVVTPGTRSTSTSACSGAADNAGNFGFFIVPGTYAYYFESGTVWNGPYIVTASIGSGGGGGSPTLVQITNGGTGQTSANAAFNALSPLTTLGDMLVFDIFGNNARLPGNIAATNKLLCQTGTGSLSAPPAWCSLVSSDIPSPIAASTTGNAATASALQTSPTQCSGGQFALGIATSGNANCGVPAGSIPNSSQIGANVYYTSTTAVGPDTNCLDNGNGTYTCTKFVTSGSNGGFQGVEGTGGTLDTPVAGLDEMWADSALTWMAMNNSNKGKDAVAGITGTPVLGHIPAFTSNLFEFQDSYTPTGTGTGLATTTGAFVSQNCVKTDANHNFVDTGSPCGGGGGSSPGGSPTQWHDVSV
jgi:hypothetical protein